MRARCLLARMNTPTPMNAWRPTARHAATCRAFQRNVPHPRESAAACRCSIITPHAKRLPRRQQLIYQVNNHVIIWYKSGETIRYAPGAPLNRQVNIPPERNHRHARHAGSTRHRQRCQTIQHNGTDNGGRVHLFRVPVCTRRHNPRSTAGPESNRCLLRGADEAPAPRNHVTRTQDIYTRHTKMRDITPPPRRSRDTAIRATRPTTLDAH